MADEVQQWSMKIDAAADGTTYFGYAPRGTADDAQGWLIKRIVRVGNDVTEGWASSRPQSVWNDRATETYT